jgi:hypothetical protein
MRTTDVNQMISSLEDELSARMSEKIANEIDFEIMCGFLMELGWTKVVLTPMTYEHGQDIDTWMKNNITGHFETMGLVWVFENPKDASWFILKWA